jgi:hypothetical protein
LKILFAFIFVVILSFGIGQSIRKSENDNVKKSQWNEKVFKNSLLPLPDREPIVMEPLPLPKDPPPTPEPMPHSKSEKAENPHEHRTQKQK